ncbi:uncharacterized protein LOC134254910 [Saccostrea cucullata]|uniref:uncharacterized protein LOC134254910 n=1 Tax=Saccostrea cuccullata TaxID=36930 RepID=UPI002ED0788D
MTSFLDLNEQDLKDLSTSFKIRKQIRKFLEELHENDDGADGSDSPQFQRKRSASPPYLPQIQRPKKLASMRLATTDDYMYLIPKSEILDNPTHHSKQSIETERRRIVRISMDSLIGQNGGRPSEAELQMLARQMASQYPILRDRPSEGLRNNYNSLVGFLRRRMYNITPPVSTKGRKKGYNCIKKQVKMSMKPDSLLM